jgi:DNA-binding protein YbaB
MTGDDFIDIETLDGQSELMRRARAAIESIKPVEAESADGLVRVRVNVSGVVVGMDLADETSHLDRVELAQLITKTVQQASLKASAIVATELQELYDGQARLIDELETADPATASALREISANTRPPDPRSSTPDPLDFCSPFERRTSSDTSDDW